jgi:putative peptide zinc metalloprotease protein
VTLATDRSVDDRPMVGCPSRRFRPESSRSRSGVPAGADDAPRLAEGVQLLGEYAGTGYKQAQYLARRPGGQLVQLSELLHRVADECDGASSYEQIAERVSASYGKTVSADNVRTLVGKLRPLGVLAAGDGSSPEVQESDPLLGLKLRAQLLAPRTVRRLAAVVRPVFWPPLVLAVIGGLLAVDVWLFFVHGVGQGPTTDWALLVHPRRHRSPRRWRRR